MPTAPTLAKYDAYKVSGTYYRNIPYGGNLTWLEPTLNGRRLALAFDLYLPSTQGPHPVIVWFHANSMTKLMQETGPLRDVLNEARAAGFAFASVEFRHPMVNVADGAPHLDVGRALQAIRAAAGAFHLDTENVFVLCRSRGSLALWQGLQPDLAEPDARTWARRQSSAIKGIWAFNPQTTYVMREIADRYVIADQRAAFNLVHPTDPRMGSALASVATATNRPHLALRNEYTYYGVPQSKRTVEGNPHYPDFQLSLAQEYVAAGDGAKVDAEDKHPENQAYVGAVEWFTSLLGRS